MKPQTFALITAAVVGGTGLMGIIQSAVESKGTKRAANFRAPESQGRIGGVVPTNTLFNYVRLGIGVAGLIAAREEKSAVLYNRGVALSYAGMGVMGMIPATESMFGLMPLYGANVALHAGIAAAELTTETELLSQAKEMLPHGVGSESASALHS